MKKPAVILLSGGLDSTTCAAIADDAGYEMHGLTINYGQRHNYELKAARAVAKQFKFKSHAIIELDLASFGGSSLVSDKVEIPKNRNLNTSNNIPSTYVPARNTVFLSIALAKAETLNAFDIYIGVNAIDYSGYPDCRPEFLSNMNSAAQTCHTYPINVEAPFVDLTKGEIVKIGLTLGIDYSKTWTCYEGKERACGQCGSCNERLEAFALNNSIDPLLYKN